MKRYLLILVAVFILGSFNVYSQASPCTDSDGKINIYTKGLTKGIEIETNSSISREDYCSGPSLMQRIIEWFQKLFG